MTTDLLKDAGNIHAIGRNYVAHIQELGNAMPSEPVVFAKAAASLTNAQILVFPQTLGPIHFELELVLRLGSDLPCGSFENLDCISHLGLGIDFTARELQGRLKAKGLPWERAKSFENACWLGSMTSDFDLGSPILFQLHQNGELRQDGDSSLMMFNFETIVRFINGNLALYAGDLIYTGTPAGVGPVRSGDVLQASSTSLGMNSTVRIESTGV